MNRLNLPPPFCETSGFPGSLHVVSDEDLQKNISGEVEEMDVSSGTESEIGSGILVGGLRSRVSL